MLTQDKRLRSRRAGTSFAALLVLAPLAGCAPGAKPAANAARAQATPAVSAGDLMSSQDRARLEALAAARANGASDEGYRIGPDDLLDIRIPDVLDGQGAGLLNRPAPGAPGPVAVAAAPAAQGLRVSDRGDITLPFIGQVHAEGLTPTELETEIARRLVKEGILRQPRVSVQIAEYRSRVVAVIGSVERPGVYPLTRPRATLADLVWAAGGPSKEAGRVVEFAPTADSAASRLGEAASDAAPIRIDIELLLHAPVDHGGGLNPRVRPGDVITVSPAGSVLVDGWVQKPGSYPVTRGLTLSGAIAAAGGNLFAADPHHAAVKRTLGPGEERSFEVDLQAVRQGRASDVPITDGDVVRVPASTIRLVPWGAYSLMKGLVYVGGSVPLF
jgi:polysaccharide export outer membrane protein